MEYNFACINADGYVSHDHVTVTRFRYLLDSLKTKTRNTTQELADMTVKGWQMLREQYGKDMKLLALMEAANDAIPDGYRMINYAEIMALLVMMIGP